MGKKRCRKAPSASVWDDRFSKRSTRESGPLRVLRIVDVCLTECGSHIRPEKRVEWRSQFSVNRGVCIHEDAIEEHLIELSFDVIRSRPVGEGAINRQIEGDLQIVLDNVEVDVGCVQLAGYREQACRYAVLFLSQQLKRDGVLVMRLHQLLALAFKFLPFSAEAVELRLGVILGSMFMRVIFLM